MAIKKDGYNNSLDKSSNGRRDIVIHLSSIKKVFFLNSLTYRVFSFFPLFCSSKSKLQGNLLVNFSSSFTLLIVSRHITSLIAQIILNWYPRKVVLCKQGHVHGEILIKVRSFWWCNIMMPVVNNYKNYNLLHASDTKKGETSGNDRLVYHLKS